MTFETDLNRRCPNYAFGHFGHEGQIASSRRPFEVWKSQNNRTCSYRIAIQRRTCEGVDWGTPRSGPDPNRDGKSPASTFGQGINILWRESMCCKLQAIPSSYRMQILYLMIRPNSPRVNGVRSRIVQHQFYGNPVVKKTTVWQDLMWFHNGVKKVSDESNLLQNSFYASQVVRVQVLISCDQAQDKGTPPRKKKQVRKSHLGCRETTQMISIWNLP